MLRRRFRADLRVLSLIIFAFIVLAPMSAQASGMGLTYGNWEVDGFFRNTTGLWTENFTYSPNNDPLAMCRSTFRLNLNGKISNSLRLKAEVLGRYEPEYSRERNGGIPANKYNNFDFREMRLDWRPVMGHNIRFGKQIVNWGEALTGRVGNIVNSFDAQWDLGLTNLEDTQMPTWMIRGIHQFYNIGTTFDWIFAPYLEVSRYRTSRTLAWNSGLLESNGTNNGADYTGLGTERFSLYPEDRIIIPGSGQVLGRGTDQVNDVLGAGTGILFPAFQQVLYGNAFHGPTYAPFAGGIPGTGWSGNYISTSPKSSLSDARYGFKTSSTIFGAQTGVYFYRSHLSAWGTTTTKYNPTTGDLIGVWDRVNYYGIYANKNFDFGVLRTDIAYAPNYKATCLDLRKYPTMEGEVDKLKVQVGYNKDFLFSPLNENQTFGLIVEYIGEFLTGGDKGDALYSWVHHETVPDALHQVAVSLGTNYNFGMYAPAATVIWNDNNCGLAQASLKYNPDWMNRKWTFKLQYTSLFGEQYDYVYGWLKEKDNIALQTQFSFP